ncbi:MAG TPA: hypothetical protein VNY05_33610 [Candidatus Acidoferrales bacterium]|jgi:hypothetical protein|nr:hypothetical protein [Candidatus Acidoferrales bacterium]
MHRGTDRHFAGFQVQVSQTLAILQHAPDEPVYFVFRFSAKCFCSSFPTAPTLFILDASEWTTLTDPIVDLDQFFSTSSLAKRTKVWYCSTSFSISQPFPVRSQRQIPRLGPSADTDVEQILAAVPRVPL